MSIKLINKKVEQKYIVNALFSIQVQAAPINQPTFFLSLYLLDLKSYQCMRG